MKKLKFADLQTEFEAIDVSETKGIMGGITWDDIWNNVNSTGGYHSTNYPSVNDWDNLPTDSTGYRYYVDENGDKWHITETTVNITRHSAFEWYNCPVENSPDPQGFGELKNAIQTAQDDETISDAEFGSLVYKLMSHYFEW